MVGSHLEDRVLGSSESACSEVAHYRSRIPLGVDSAEGHVPTLLSSVGNPFGPFDISAEWAEYSKDLGLMVLNHYPE